MQRRQLLLAFSQVLLTPNERNDFTVWFGDLAAHLTQDSAPEFVAEFDRALPRRATLETNVFTLLRIASVASQIDLREITGEGDRRSINADWTLIVRPKQDGTVPWRRRRILKFDLERRKKKWIITGFDDPGFFSPQQ